MTGEVVNFPGGNCFVAINGGPALWLVGRWIGQAQDQRYPQLTFTSYEEARREALEMGAEYGLDVLLLSRLPVASDDGPAAA